MRVLEATGNTIEAIRKAWELRQDLTDKENRRNCRNTVSSRSNSSSYSGYTGEFRLSPEVKTEKKNLTLCVSNGLTDNAAHAGRVLLGGKLLAKCPAYSRTVSSSETSLSAVFVWLKLELADSTIRSGYEISNSDEPPKTDGSYGFPFYVLIGAIQGGTAPQAHYGPAVITDRYYDDTKTGENS
mgnify:CR=1 FL=1